MTNLTPEERARLEERLLARGRTAMPSSATESPVKSAPLTPAQVSIWCACQLAPASPLYHMPQAFRLRGPLDLDALERAFAALVERQEALRLQFRTAGGATLQSAHRADFRLPRVDLRSLPAANRATELDRLLRAEAGRPFDLAKDLPMRAALIECARDDHVLIVVLHHLIADFASLEIIQRELTLFYRGCLNGKPMIGSPLPMAFLQWAAREHPVGGRPRRQAGIEYWTERLKGGCPALLMPTDRPRKQARSGKGARRLVWIEPDLAMSLRELASREGVTLYALLLAAFQTFLFRYTLQDDLLVGTPVARRTEPELQDLVGLFLHLIPIRTRVSAEGPFLEMLRGTNEAALGAFAHAEVPIETVLEQLRLPEGGAELFPRVVFQFLPNAWPTPAFPGVAAESLPVETGTSKFELTLTLMDAGRGFGGEWEYDTDLFDSETVDQWFHSFTVLLRSIIANPQTPVAVLPLADGEDRQRLIYGWNETAVPYPRDASIHSLLEQEVAKNPDGEAVLSVDERVTYADLNSRANRLARFLRRAGIERNERVAVCLERSVQSIVSLLGILKAGAAYVPLDLKYPAVRLRSILEDANPFAVIGEPWIRTILPPGTKLVSFEQCGRELALESPANLAVPVEAADLAYIIYTSGSTGQSKGVAVPHRAVVRLVRSTHYAHFGPEEVFLQLAPLAFDASTFEIWGALLHGGTLALAPSAVSSLAQLSETITRYQVTTLWLTAGLFREMVQGDLSALKSLRQLLAGGDVLSVPHILKFLREAPGCVLINGYGPTENTTFTCCHRFPPDWLGATSAPIGRPISNTQAYILDGQCQPVPPGVVGELCVAGDGLALGYWNSPELTAARFIRHPFREDPGGRMYRTGDLCRFGRDGTIEFVGRVDDQIKVNGFRVHVSEVEGALERLPQVRQAAVTVQAAEGGKQLWAHVVPSRPALPMEELASLVKEQLPAFMVPSRFISYEHLPLTSNGKVDRRALSQLEPKATKPVASTPPSPIEQQIIDIWKEALRRGDVGLDDHFFQLGGHSLLGLRVLARINQAFARSLTLDVLFQAPTVRLLAERVSRVTPAAVRPPIARRPRPGHEPI